MTPTEQAVLLLAKQYAYAAKLHKTHRTLDTRRALFDAEIDLLKRAQKLHRKDGKKNDRRS